MFGFIFFQKSCRYGFVMAVRASVSFTKIIEKYRANIPDFDEKALMIYSMWKGYREPGNAMDSFLNLVSNQADLHTSGHASAQDVADLAEACKAQKVVPMHSDAPEILRDMLGDKVTVISDGEVMDI